MPKEKKEVFEEVENKINIIRKNKNRLIEQLNEEKNQNNEELNAIIETLNNPEIDFKDFKEKTVKKIFLEQRQNYINEQIKAGADQPAISKEEYETLITEIMGEYETEYTKIVNRILPQLTEIKEDIDKLSIICGHANNLLTIAQKDLYKYNDMPINATGVKCIIPAKMKQTTLPHRIINLKLAIKDFEEPNAPKEPAKIWGSARGFE